MTLLERAQRAESFVSDVPTTLETKQLEDLRAQVQDIVSIDAIAVMAKKNPQRARNEVRSACRRAFGDRRWGQTTASERERLVSRLIDAVFGFGLLEDLLADAYVTEIMVNGTSSIYYEREGKLCRCDRHYESEAELRALIDRILGPLGRRVDEASPMVNARLPQGHRVNVVMPPVSLVGPVMTIRKFASRVMTLSDMRHCGTIEERVQAFLEWAVLQRKSIAVSGGTGSGKTTLLNALSCVIPHAERIITVEDSAELRFLEHPHVIGLEARPRNAEGLGQVTIRDLVTNALRMRPDRIIVGECRGAEALDMLQAMNTGHDGSLTTLHANSPEESIARLETMVRYDADLPIDVVEANIASAIDVIVQMKRDANGSRFVSKVVGLQFDREDGRCSTVPIYSRLSEKSEGRWVDAAAWAEKILREGESLEWEGRTWTRTC